MRADRKKIEQLLKTARGQIEGILKMIEDDRYCVDISNQIMATEAILNKANKEVISAHIKGCVLSAANNEDQFEKEKKIDEMISLIDKLAK
ncbi:DNA-binding transcriptional regulator, FrmR family [Acetitomaculum ruminis DSM 5522]|uniref:Copper-sensing transcriptional repressor CsoR n=1 Tax=Acetitomaculum ruminis DSM 5522 TaxID=1120918 RepID=A0A1I0WZH9_9FIRM|nr:metal-sensing transcriptional repressor [Acetitomaculum ruminis]SFA94129.1 DNA-binding transcriptional regulator, FrmR family [Acetitomaculum ruminis DSM 5522]